MENESVPVQIWSETLTNKRLPSSVHHCFVFAPVVLFLWLSLMSTETICLLRDDFSLGLLGRFGKILLTKSALWWIRYHDHKSLRHAVGSWIRLAAEDGPTVNESINEDIGEYLARLLWEWNKWYQESGMCLERLWQEMTPTLSQLLELGFPVSIRVLCRQEQSDWTHRVSPKSVSSAVRLIAIPPSIYTSMEHRASSSRQQRPNVCGVKDFFVRKSSRTHFFFMSLYNSGSLTPNSLKLGLWSGLDYALSLLFALLSGAKFSLLQWLSFLVNKMELMV